MAACESVGEDHRILDRLGRALADGGRRRVRGIVDQDDATVSAALASYESIRRPRAEAVLKMSRRADKAAQIGSHIGSRLRNALVRRLPERAQRRQLEPLARYELPVQQRRGQSR